MATHYREILHCKTDTSDKVYIVEVTEIGKNKYAVVATWGKRTAPRLSTQVKNEYTYVGGAVTAARQLADAKKRSKDRYVVAAASLSIKGFNRTGDNINAGIIESKSTKETTIQYTQEPTPGRRITL